LAIGNPPHPADEILTHYADPLEFTSPLVVERLGRADGTIRRRDELRGYFAQGVGPGSALRFDLLEALPGVDSVAQTVIEAMRLNAQHQADRVVVHYSPAP
jgi:hypothetical protein